jgi:hypothetical protein
MLKRMMVLVAAVLVIGTAGTMLASAEDFDVAAGKVYTLSLEPDANYPDPDGAKLTDGSANFSWGDMVGFNNPPTNPIIVVDLGDIYDNITYVALKMMKSAPSGINTPQNFIVSISEDGELYEDLGMGIQYAEAPVPDDSIATQYWATNELPGYGRYVRIEITPTGTAWTMIAEVTIGNGEIPEVYNVTYDQPVDLTNAEIVSVGKPYVLIPVPSEAYPDTDATKVTDGFARYSWGDMIGFDSPATNPTAIIDLQGELDVVKVSGSFMRSYASAVNLPTSLLIFVSNDGVDFTPVNMAIKTDPSPPQNEAIIDFYWEASAPVTARYVKVEVRPRGTAWTMLAEVAIWAIPSE